ncbi:MAG: hypothetical protein KQI62_17325 [Deltaproteobacteria bacterium]|nr:hypothetical protein [Deltaproteobacteria bacterium]
MKKVFIALLAAAPLLPAGLAHAWAIYNHVDKEVCLQDRTAEAVGGCRNLISADGKLNGEHGAGLHKVSVVWAHSKSCRGTTENFDIPDSGYARVYDNEVKIYKHDGKHVDTVQTHDCGCPDNSPFGSKKK